MIRRRFSAQYGNAPIYVSTAGGLKFFAHSVEHADPVLIATAAALVRPGDTVWDIGANIGCFTVAAAVLTGASGAVFAFEPDTSLVALLRRTASEQAAETAPITVVPAAVAGSTGLRTFQVAERARAANALEGYGGSQMGGVRERQTILSMSVDDCLAWTAAPNVVKIDVEGAERELLTPGCRLLTEIRPAIACEVSAENVDAVTDALVQAHYALYDAEALPLRETARRDSATFNTIAIPSERQMGR